MLGSAFNRMDLVTREEFDIQQQVLIKTRTKLAELEARLAKLEAAQEPEEAALKAAETAAEEAVAEIKTTNRSCRIRPSETCRLLWFTAAP